MGSARIQNARQRLALTRRDAFQSGTEQGTANRIVRGADGAVFAKSFGCALCAFGKGGGNPRTEGGVEGGVEDSIRRAILKNIMRLPITFIDHNSILIHERAAASK